MPIYVFKCGCGVRFEQITPLGAPAPGCPACGGESRKIPAGASLGGQAATGLSRDRMPQTWRGTRNGDREYVTHLQRQWDRRQRLEAKHPEIADDQRPILAHEGRYHDAPLRAGDPVLGSGAGSGGGGGAGGGHGHGHGHGHTGAGDGGAAQAPAKD